MREIVSRLTGRLDIVLRHIDTLTSLLVFVCTFILPSHGQDIEKLLGPTSELRASLSSFTAEGSFYLQWTDLPIQRPDDTELPEGFVWAYTPGTKSAKGTFRWVKDAARHYLEINLTSTRGVTELQLKNSFHRENVILSDGEMQLVFSKSPAFTTGCKALVYPLNWERREYQVFCSFVPIQLSPERGEDCFIPKELFETHVAKVDGSGRPLR